MAEKTRTMLDNEVKGNVGEVIVNALQADGLTVGKSASATYLFQVPDANGDDRWVEVQVMIPKGPRDGSGFDGQTAISDYAETLKDNAAKAKAREEKSKAEQVKRAAKDAEKAAKAAAKAAAEAAKVKA